MAVRKCASTFLSAKLLLDCCGGRGVTFFKVDSKLYFLDVNEICFISQTRKVCGRVF